MNHMHSVCLANSRLHRKIKNNSLSDYELLKNNQRKSKEIKMRGGKRSGAGRRKGAPNKATATRQAAISASGEAPLDYMIRVMRDKRAPVKRRDDMAKAAAPYVHPKLAAIEYAGTLSGKPPSRMTDEELIVIIREGHAQLAALNFDEERKPSN
jgi:hypothetical protein